MPSDWIAAITAGLIGRIESATVIAASAMAIAPDQHYGLATLPAFVDASAKFSGNDIKQCWRADLNGTGTDLTDDSPSGSNLEIGY